MLRELQASDSFGIRVEEAKGSAGGIMVFRAHHADETATANAKKVRELLGLNPDAQEFRLAFGTVPQDDKEIAMLTRCMIVRSLGKPRRAWRFPRRTLRKGESQR